MARRPTGGQGSPVARAGRLLRTVARLHPAQLAFRPLHVARTALLGRVPLAARLLAGNPAARPGPRLVVLQGSLPEGLPGLAVELARARRALGGELELVGHRLPLRPPETDFVAPEDPKLVRYQLNYLDIARSLAVAARCESFPAAPKAARLAVAHVREFVDRVPPGLADAWEPYAVATRLLNLVVARDLLGPVADPDERAFLDGPLVVSLARHARWLTATLELHLLGNHLFTDGAALFVAGCALDAGGAGAWRTLGDAIVTRSLAFDVLGDGGHAERSPMYQALYLDQLELVIAAARAARVPAPAGAREAAEALGRQLLAVAHPDGDLPLLGDSALDEAPLPEDLAGPLGLAPDSLRRRLYGVVGAAVPVDGPLRLFPETGLAAVREGGELLVLDAGPLGTRDQPGHAHADALSFELSHQGRRLVVDGGAGHYEADEARAYFRGPFAHSGVSVDGEGPDELWASFRAGGRGRVEPLTTTRTGGLFVLRGAVRAAGGWRSERLVFYVPGALCAVFDRTEGVREGAHVRSHLLFAPDVDLAAGLSPDALLVQPVGRPPLPLVRLLGGRWARHRGEERPRRGFQAARLGRFEPTWAVELDASPLGGAFGAAHALVLGAGRAEAVPGGALLEAGGVRVHVGLDRRGLRWEELAP